MEEEQKFARALANPVKSVRDRTVSELKKYLVSLDDMSDLEMLKLWKALFYCLWLADKAPVQEELCTSLADLLGVFKKLSFGFNKYLRMFFRTILREWAQLDQYRLNKFYTLVRSMVNKSFSLLKESNWNSKNMSIFQDVVYTEVLQNPPNGPRFHMCDIYLPELLDVTNGNVQSDTFVKLIEPFTRSICTTEDAVFHGRVCQRLFLDYTETLAREHAASAEDSAKATEAETEVATVFKQVSSVRLQKMLFDLASGDECIDRHRKRIYVIHEAFQKLTRVFVADDVAVSKDDPSTEPIPPTPAEVSSSPSTKKSNKKKSSKSSSGMAPTATVTEVEVVDASRSAKHITKKGKDKTNGHVAAAAPAVCPTPTPEEQPKFIAGSKFSGPKPGYAFKKGPKGVGYYIDKHSKTSFASSPKIPTPSAEKKRKAVSPSPKQEIVKMGEGNDERKTKKKKINTLSSNGSSHEGDSGVNKKKEKASTECTDGDASGSSEAKRVRFGKPHTKDYRLSVEGLRAAAPDLSSTPVKGVIKKATTRSATKKAAANGSTIGSGSPRRKAAEYF